MKSLPSFCLRPFLLLTLFLASTLYASNLGEVWDWRNPLPQGNPLYELAHGNDTFVAVGEAGVILTSNDTENWAVQRTGSSNWLTGVIHGDNKFVAVGSEGSILTSSDGMEWVSVNSETTAWLWDINYFNNAFWAIGSGGDDHKFIRCHQLDSPSPR